MPATDVLPPTGVDAPSAPRSPAATRLRRPSWRDPRLAVGLVLVVASTLAGARAMTAADESEAVWVTAAAVRAGDDVSDVQLVPGRALLEDAATPAVYLGTDTEPVGVFDRDLQRGELVPVDALDRPGDQHSAEVPLSVEAGAAPVDLAGGDLVDVWVVPESADTGRAAAAERVLRAAPVAVAGPVDSLATASRAVVVRVDAVRGARQLGGVLGVVGSGRVVLVRVGD